jgi:glyoxylase-like metal-dependent hydrolase (beta-lactamase superfamily II)
MRELIVRRRHPSSTAAEVGALAERARLGSGGMELDRIHDWLFRLSTPIVQAYAVRQGSGVCLVDTTTAGQADEILRSLSDELGVRELSLHAIVLTHGHADHTGSAAALAEATGARVLGPAAEANVIQGVEDQLPPQLEDWEVPIFEQVMPHVPAAPPVQLDELLSSGDSLDWDLRPEVVGAPGHTSGQIALWFPAERVLIAGDAVASHEGTPMPGVFNVDPVQAKRTFAALARLDPTIACFGHGEPLLDRAGERMLAVVPADAETA